MWITTSDLVPQLDLRLKWENIEALLSNCWISAVYYLHIGTLNFAFRAHWDMRKRHHFLYFEYFWVIFWEMYKFDPLYYHFCLSIGWRSYQLTHKHNANFWFALCEIRKRVAPGTKKSSCWNMLIFLILILWCWWFNNSIFWSEA